jgi:hypothetical protein
MLQESAYPAKQATPATFIRDVRNIVGRVCQLLRFGKMCSQVFVATKKVHAPLGISVPSICLCLFSLQSTHALLCLSILSVVGICKLGSAQAMMQAYHLWI